jgi:hypothetical protein
MKEQLATGLSKGQVAEFVENDEVHAREIFGEPPLPAGAGFTLQPIDEIDDGIEAAPGAAADTGPRNGYGQMRLAGASSADQHGIALFSQKGAARQIADQRLVNWCAGEVRIMPPRRATAGSFMTLCWRKPDSNSRSRSKRNAGQTMSHAAA